MNFVRPRSKASSSYNDAKHEVLENLQVMKQAMEKMGLNTSNSTSILPTYRSVLKTFGNELDNEVIRAIALNPYLSDGNHPKVIAFGRLELEKALKEFRQEEQRLDGLQKKTAELVEILSGDPVSKHD